MTTSLQPNPSLIWLSSTINKGIKPSSALIFILGMLHIVSLIFIHNNPAYHLSAMANTIILVTGANKGELDASFPVTLLVSSLFVPLCTIAAHGSAVPHRSDSCRDMEASSCSSQDTALPYP